MGVGAVRVFFRLPASVKGHALVDFLVNHPLDLGDQLPDRDDDVICVNLAAWEVDFDGSLQK